MFALKCIEPESEIILKCEDIKQEEDVQDIDESLLIDVKEELLTEFEIKTEYFNDSNEENFADCAFEQETISIHPAEDILDVEFNQTISKRKLSDVELEETEALKALLSDHNYFNNKRNNLDVTKTLDSETVSSLHHDTEINENAVVFPTEEDSQQPHLLISQVQVKRRRIFGTYHNWLCQCPNCQVVPGFDKHLCHIANCGKIFNKVCHLEAHIRNHIEEARPYQCPEPGCGANYDRLDSLKRHTWAHNTTSRFTCQVCDKRYHRADSFRKHIVKCSQTNAVSTEECIGRMDSGELESKRVTGH